MLGLRKVMKSGESVRETHRAELMKGSGASCVCSIFFADRLKVQLRDQGARHDLVDAVFSLGGQDDLLMIVRRVEALGKFLDTDDGKNLLAGTKRAEQHPFDRREKGQANLRRGAGYQALQGR